MAICQFQLVSVIYLESLPARIICVDNPDPCRRQYVGNDGGNEVVERVMRSIMETGVG